MSHTPTRRGVMVGTVAFAIIPALRILPAKAAPAIHDIRIRNFRFDPEHITVRLGDILRWTNLDLAQHTATATKSKGKSTDKSRGKSAGKSAGKNGWDTGKIAKNASARITVFTDMATDYVCLFHPNMKGTITFETP